MSWNVTLSPDSELKLAQDVSEAIGAFKGTEPYAVKNIPDGECSNKMLGAFILAAAEAKAEVSVTVEADGSVTISGAIPEAPAKAEPKAPAKAPAKGRRNVKRTAEAEVTTYNLDPKALKALRDAGFTAAEAIEALS